MYSVQVRMHLVHVKLTIYLIWIFTYLGWHLWRKKLLRDLLLNLLILDLQTQTIKKVVPRMVTCTMATKINNYKINVTQNNQVRLPFVIDSTEWSWIITITLSAFSLTSLSGSSSNFTRFGIAFASIAEFFPFVVIVILKRKKTF